MEAIRSRRVFRGWRGGRALLLGLTIALGACDSPTAPTGPVTAVVDEYRAAGMLLTASSRALADGRLDVTLTVTNESAVRGQIGILGGNCQFRPRVYSERGGRLRWSAFDLHDACQEPLRLYDLEGGASISESQTFDVDLGDGDYFVTLTIEHLDLVELAAGAVSFR
jgi:hypothetical protein